MYPPSMFRAKIRKKYVLFFHLKIIVLTAVKNCSILRRRVILMRMYRSIYKQQRRRIQAYDAYILSCKCFSLRTCNWFCETCTASASRGFVPPHRAANRLSTTGISLTTFLWKPPFCIYLLVLKHPHSNMILSSFCIPKVVKMPQIFLKSIHK